VSLNVIAELLFNRVSMQTAMAVCVGGNISADWRPSQGVSCQCRRQLPEELLLRADWSTGTTV
jgi:hypothetical protein